MNYIKNFSLSGITVIFLSIFIIFNPNTSLDLASFLLVGFIILQKIFREYFILALLALRPTLDYWRDYNIFSWRFLNFNINAALAIFLLLWSTIFFIKNFTYFKTLPLKIPWLLLLTWCASSILYSYHLPSTLIETIKLTNLFCLFGICYIMSQKDKDKFKTIFLKSIFASAVIPMLFAFYQLITKSGITIDDISNRIYGTFAHPNVLATFALLLLIVLIEKFLFPSAQERGLGTKPSDNSPSLHLGKRETIDSVWPKYLMFFALLATIAFTYTRIAWIGVVVLFIIIGFFYYRKILLYSLASIILFYMLFYPLNRYLVSNYNTNLQANGLVARLTSRNQDADSVNWRTQVVSKVLPLFRKKYLVGYGYGTFPRVWDDNKDIGNIWDNTSEAHNDYIKIALESGIVGLLLFLSIFAVLLYKQIIFALRNNFKNIIFVTSIFIYLILSLSDNMLHHTPVIWWFWAVWGVWSEGARS